MITSPLASATDGQLLAALRASLAAAPERDLLAAADRLEAMRPMPAGVVSSAQAALAAAPAALDENLNHLYCCDEDLALCGTDITDWTVDEDCEIDCVVCAALDGESCGAPGCPGDGAS